jgi:galactose mutarotase-like enzyme
MSSSGRGQVLIPWPNRLQDGRYEFDGRRHQLPLNEPEHRNAIHGLVRWANWTTAEREPHRAVMELAKRTHRRRGSTPISRSDSIAIIGTAMLA